MNKNYKCPTCLCKSQEELDEWLAGIYCDCSCHLSKKHICDGGDDYGVVDCLQCEKEMIEHLKKSKKSSEPNDRYKDHRWDSNSCGLEDTGTFADHLEESSRE